MCAATAADKPTKARTTSRGTKRKTKAERAEINRQNSRKSTGPRTAEGKGRAKFNAVTHGLTARSVLLPGEDADKFAARKREIIAGFQPRNSAEFTVVECLAGDLWISDRSVQAAGNRLAFRLRHEPLEQVKKENEEALELGGRLMWQPAFPLPISKRFEIGQLTEPPPCSESAIHPHHPARLRLRLEQTVAGCDWLLDRWSGLWQRLNVDYLWRSSDAFQMVRLMGKHAINMADDLSVAIVFLASVALRVAPKHGPERASFDWKQAMIEMLITFDVDGDSGTAAMVANQCEPFARRLGELPLSRLAPVDDEEARKRLNSLIEPEIRRLRQIRAELQAIADLDLAEAPGRLAFETGTEGERHRRYALSHERVLNRRFGMFLSTRKMTEAGSLDLVDLIQLERYEPVELPVIGAIEPDEAVAAVEPAPTPKQVQNVDLVIAPHVWAEQILADAMTAEDRSETTESGKIGPAADSSMSELTVSVSGQIDGMVQERVLESSLAPRENFLSRSERHSSDSHSRYPRDASCESCPIEEGCEVVNVCDESSCGTSIILRNEANVDFAKTEEGAATVPPALDLGSPTSLTLGVSDEFTPVPETEAATQSLAPDLGAPRSLTLRVGDNRTSEIDSDGASSPPPAQECVPPGTAADDAGSSIADLGSAVVAATDLYTPEPNRPSSQQLSAEEAAHLRRVAMFNEMLRKQRMPDA